MNLRNSICKTKWFNFSDFNEEDTSGAKIHIANPITHPKFFNERAKLFIKIEDPDERVKALPKLIIRHLLLGWEGLGIDGRLIKFTKKNAQVLMKNTVFNLWVFGCAFGDDSFAEKIDFGDELELEPAEVEKN